MTWGICTGLQWGHWKLFRSACIFVCSQCYFFSQISINSVINGKNSNEFCWMSNNIYFVSTCNFFLPNKLFKGVIRPSKGDPPLKWRVKFVASLFLTATAGLSVAFFQSCSISIKATWNCLSIDTNIDMYVPFCKTIDDVTFRFSLHHHFLTAVEKKTVEHNQR